ncbi:acetyl-CoA carboxylase, biotin carboxyl carrier protein, partial [Leuconostoc mesenteroides subsp. cremoris]
MSINIEEIRGLIADLENSSLRELKVVDGEFSLHLSKNKNEAVVNAPVQTPVVAPSAVTSDQAQVAAE